jgi:hypothetical protein
MIEVLGAAGLLAFLVSSATIGVRLLNLARRTRGVPELALGAGFLVGCVAGYVPETIVLSTDVLSPAGESVVLAITQVAIRLAALSVLVFTWQVFRADEPWARVFTVAVAVALLMSWLAFPYTRIQADNARDLFWYDFYAVARSVAVGWGAVESLRYYRGSLRRMRLGLVDATATRRFLMWGVGLAAMTVLMASTLLAEVFGVDPAVAGWVLLESTAGLVGAAALWLTFFPGRRARVATSASGQEPPG